jgi:hypothetical protein
MKDSPPCKYFLFSYELYMSVAIFVLHNLICYSSKKIKPPTEFKSTFCNMYVSLSTTMYIIIS